MSTEKTGKLKYAGYHRYPAHGGDYEITYGARNEIEGVSGFFCFFECVDCKTSYIAFKGEPYCNGVQISLCPWCRPDYQPFRNGA
jgi:hypothetical protein